MIINKKRVILIGVIILIIIGIIVGIESNKNRKNKEEILKLNEVEFTNIRKEYEGGITTIRADVRNNTEETRSVNVKIMLKDGEGNVIAETEQELEDIEAGRKKFLAAGIMGDYSNASSIELSEIK